jgi:hypothetical protein
LKLRRTIDREPRWTKTKTAFRVRSSVDRRDTLRNGEKRDAYENALARKRRKTAATERNERPTERERDEEKEGVLHSMDRREREERIKRGGKRPFWRSFRAW